MPFISWHERQRRMRDSIQEAWENGGKTPDDPGLRETYETIGRAPIRLIVLPLGKAVNHGGMTRIADAYRIERVDLTQEPDRAIDFSGQRGTKTWQPWRWVPFETALAEARQEGYSVAALTLSNRAVDVAQAPWRFPLALVIGEENGGIPDEVERECDFSIAIPLYGLVTSLNVVTATAIALEYALREYSRVAPEFQPVRRGSRRLVGLEPRVYEMPD
jgi:23S rRNA (guanosine2251-2'-O)-methyltransferase